MTSTLTEGQRVPDILDCLAQLSSDEVPTPPKLANAMLDLLPAKVWRSPDYRWLDPCSKSGVFLREIARRLLFEGLVEWEPDFEKRREHIFRNMIFGCGITELTGTISRRTVYYSSHAAGKHSVIEFDSDQGNLPFVRAKHDLRKKGGCRICGAPASLERGESRENYAYAFIHGAYPTKEMKGMKFDVIVGNPPYQLGASGGESGGGFAMPTYHRFVDAAIELAPRYLVMITPSRWFAGGRNLGEFRGRMLADKRLREIVDFPNAEDCFPGNEIKGGVSYFLWDRSHNGPCRITTWRHGALSGEPAVRDLDAYDILVRYNAGVDILEKVRALDGSDSWAPKVSPVQPFSLRTTFRGADTPDGLVDPVALYSNKAITYVEREKIPRNRAWIDEWKVLLSRAYGAGESVPHQIMGQPVLAGPGTACTETYLVVGRFAAEDEARRFATFLSSRFVRFLVSLRKNTQDLYSERFAFVPDLPMDRVWTDAALYERYGLTDGEIAFIESQVKEMRTPEPVE